MLAYHTQGNVIYWKYLNFEPEGSRALAERFAAVSGYACEDTPYASGFAGYKDWFIQNFDRPGYTIECGLGENPLPLSQFESIWNANLGILTLGAGDINAATPTAFSAVGVAAFIRNRSRIQKIGGIRFALH